MLNSVRAIDSCELTAAESLRAQYVTLLHIPLLHYAYYIITLHMLPCYIIYVTLSHVPLLHYAYDIVTLHMLHCYITHVTLLTCCGYTAGGWG